MHIPRFIQAGYIAADFWTQWDSDQPRMTLMVKVTPRPQFGGASAALGFTGNTRNMTLPGHSGITFKSTPAITPTLVESALDDASVMEFTGLYNADSFIHTEVLAGKWDFAEIEIFSVCWDNVNLGEFLHLRGNTGEFKDYQTYFTTEIRSFIGRLSNDVNKVTSRQCRVKEFRDAECKHAAATVTIATIAYNISHTLTVASVASPYQITFTKLAGAANDVPDDFFVNGKITALGATANGSLAREMKLSDTVAGTIVVTLKRRFPFTVTAGHQFTLIAGCDRTIEDCMKFVNIINRRAEDFVPGIESVNRVRSAN